MKKKIIFLFLILIFSAQLPSETLAKGGLIKSIMNFFKGGANNVIKTGDDAIKNMGKNKDEFLERIKSKTTNETISTSSTEAKITENVGFAEVLFSKIEMLLNNKHSREKIAKNAKQISTDNAVKKIIEQVNLLFL